MGKKSNGPSTYSLGDALGIAQHHDAVSGTAKQHTTDDYAKRLAIGASEVCSWISYENLPARYKCPKFLIIFLKLNLFNTLQAEATGNSALSCLVSNKSRDQCATTATFSQVSTVFLLLVCMRVTFFTNYVKEAQSFIFRNFLYIS